jgi:hypothetical protein
LNEAARRSFDNAHGRCATGSKKIAVSEVRIVPLADSSWIKQKKKVFLFLFFQKKKCQVKRISLKLHFCKRNWAIANSSSHLNHTFRTDPIDNFNS